MVFYKSIIFKNLSKVFIKKCRERKHPPAKGYCSQSLMTGHSN